MVNPGSIRVNPGEFYPGRKQGPILEDFKHNGSKWATGMKSGKVSSTTTVQSGEREIDSRKKQQKI